MTFEFDTTVTLPLIVSIATLAFAWYRTRRSAVDELFRSGRKRMEEQERRIQSLEQSVKEAPGREDFHAIQLTLAEMGGDMKAMRANMKAVADSVARQEQITSRHEDYMRENK